MPYNYISGLFFGVKDGNAFKAGLQQAIDNVASDGIYVGDNIFVFGRNLSFAEDPKLREAFKRHISSEPEAAIVWRMAVVAWAAKQGLRREGDFVECGCYRGTTARIVCDYLDFGRLDRRYFLYDLFDRDYTLAEAPGTGRGEDPLTHVRARFSDFANVQVIPGDAAKTVLENGPEKIAFMHLDLNNARAEVSVLEALWERMTPGAILVLDDYGWLAYREQKLAEDEWFAARGYDVLELPTGQGLVIK